MSIDLKKALQKKMEPRQGGKLFNFSHVGDQLIYRFLARRMTKTSKGDSDIVDVVGLAGEVLDEKTKKFVPVEPGAYSIFINAIKVKSFYDEERPSPDDVIHQRLVEIVKEANGMKLFAFEFLERARPQATDKPLDDDDVPDFKPPTKAK
jgi:hypothetical protein